MALYWIIGSGVVMSMLALSGGLMLLLPEQALRRVLLPLVAFAAGTLIGGAFLHLLPGALEELETEPVVLVLLGGFVGFFLLEQFLHWHHCREGAGECRRPLTYLILIGDGLHNFIGGLAVAGAFLIDIRLGIAAWLAAAAHEVPQEVADLAILLHGGWTKFRALMFNLLSASTFLVGGLITWFASRHVEIAWLLPFAAGNFLYIGAADLVPEVSRSEGMRDTIVNIVAFAAGLALMIAVHEVRR